MSSAATSSQPMPQSTCDRWPSLLTLVDPKVVTVLRSSAVVLTLRGAVVFALVGRKATLLLSAPGTRHYGAWTGRRPSSVLLVASHSSIGILTR